MKRRGRQQGGLDDLAAGVELLAAVLGEAGGAGDGRGGWQSRRAGPCNHLAVMGADRQVFVQREDERDIGFRPHGAQRVHADLQEMVEVHQPHALAQQDRLELAPDVGGREMVEMVVAALVADDGELAVRSEQQPAAIGGRDDGDEDRVRADHTQPLVERVGGNLSTALADRGVGVRDDGDRPGVAHRHAVRHQAVSRSTARAIPAAACRGAGGAIRPWAGSGPPPCWLVSA